MTLLSAQSIRERCGGQRPMIKPFAARANFAGMTYGLGPAGYDIRTRDAMALRPHDFIVVSTVEEFDIPLDLVMTIRDKSTLARLGLSVFNTIAEPGWLGILMVEVVNHSPWRTIKLAAGSPIAQCTFELLDSATVQPYDGKYQNQKARQGPIADNLDEAGADLATDNYYEAQAEE